MFFWSRKINSTFVEGEKWLEFRYFRINLQLGDFLRVFENKFFRGEKLLGVNWVSTFFLWHVNEHEKGLAGKKIKILKTLFFFFSIRQTPAVSCYFVHWKKLQPGSTNFFPSKNGLTGPKLNVKYFMTVFSEIYSFVIKCCFLKIKT